MDYVLCLDWTESHTKLSGFAGHQLTDLGEQLADAGLAKVPMT